MPETNPGFPATFRFLTKTENAAAVDVLLAGMDCEYPPTRECSLRAILERRTPVGHREVFRRLPTLDERARAIVMERPDRLVRVVTEVLREATAEDFGAACEAILSFRLYDAFPALVAQLVAGSPFVDQLAATVLSLTEQFYAVMCEADPQTRTNKLESPRERITSALEDAVRKYHRHQRVEVLEAFTTIARQKNVTLRHVLQRSNEAAHKPLVDLLSQSDRGGVLRLLLSMLDDPQMPWAVMEVITGRTDLKFVENLLKLIGAGPSKNVAETMARIDRIAWAVPGHPIWAELDDDAQAAAVRLIGASRIERKDQLAIWEHLIAEGKVGGRRAAAAALARFEGAVAARIALRALDDPDPTVQAHVLRQLRPRKVRDALLILLRKVDTPHEVIREALREALPEFSFRHFMTNLDTMDEATRLQSGYLVRQIDIEVPARLLSEMHCPSPVRRRRAVLGADVMGLVGQMEDSVIQLLADQDHMVRVAAAKALADCATRPSWEALRDAMLDPAYVVAEAAEQSLERLSSSLMQNVVEEQTDDPSVEETEAAV